MRADRLVSMLMLLQSRGRVAAPELAQALGVSVRTIYRDMDALSSAGIPVYAERGADGGCCLVEDYRTDLTGLNQDEARALFMLTAPGPLDSLGVGQKMRSALRKLAAALPGYLETPQTLPGMRGGRTRAQVYLDWTGWEHHSGPGEFPGMLYRAMQRKEQVWLTYKAWSGVETTQLASPLGLVAKTGEWHLAWLGHAKLHWQRVRDLLQVAPGGVNFEDPPDFDLEAAWHANLADWEAGQVLYLVQARAVPAAVAELRRRQGLIVQRQSAAPAPDGRLEVDLAFSSLEAARQNLMGLGRAVEVLEPLPLRLAIADYAVQMIHLYSGEENIINK
jgi:predicted DNA-binding transcriptional regulator YafY